MHGPIGVEKTALVASSGIGLELCRLIAVDGYGLIISARRMERLQEIEHELAGMHGIPVHAVGMDISQPFAAEKLWDAVREITASVDVLVNNAGTGMAGDFAESDPADIDHMLHLNVCAPTSLTRLVLGNDFARQRQNPQPCLAGCFSASKPYSLMEKIRLRSPRHACAGRRDRYQAQGGCGSCRFRASR